MQIIASSLALYFCQATLDMYQVMHMADYFGLVGAISAAYAAWPVEGLSANG
jgi:hypothetical protein